MLVVCKITSRYQISLCFSWKYPVMPVSSLGCLGILQFGDMTHSFMSQEHQIYTFNYTLLLLEAILVSKVTCFNTICSLNVNQLIQLSLIQRVRIYSNMGRKVSCCLQTTYPAKDWSFWIYFKISNLNSKKQIVQLENG